MLDFKVKMHQIRFALELCTRPCLAHSTPQLYLKSTHTSKGKEGRGEEAEGGAKPRAHKVASLPLQISMTFKKFCCRKKKQNAHYTSTH